MPGDKSHSRGRGSIHNWRVKAGRKDVYSREKKIDCENFIRDNKGVLNGKKLRLIPPND